MFKILLWTISMTLFIVTNTFGQKNDSQNRILNELNTIENAVYKYRDSLKTEVNVIWSLEDAKKITAQQAATKKDSIAHIYAEKIKNSVANSEQYISTEIRQRVDDIVNNKDSKYSLSIGTEGVKYKPKNDYISLKNGIYTTFEEGKFKKYQFEKRTTSQIVLAFGFNMVSGSTITDKDFKTFNSNYFEVGFTFKTRIIKDEPLLNFKYGLSVVAENLKASDDRIFVRNQEGIYNLEQTGINYKTNTFSNTSLILPLHLEFDLSKKAYSPSLDKSFVKSHQNFRIGVGGYFGLITSTYFINKWKEDNKKYTENYKLSYNIEKFNYGLSTYVGYRDFSIFAKYNLNSIFKNQPSDVNVFSIGLRIDSH